MYSMEAPLWDFSQSIDSNPKITDPSHPYLVRTSGNTGTLSTKSNKSGHEVDLELAVLQQEVSAGREEVADLRAKVYLLEKEKGAMELAMGDR